MNLVRVRRPKYFSEDIREEMDRMLRDAFEDIGLVESSREGKEMTTWRPAVELNEQNGNYQLKAELPGIQKDNIDVEVSEDSISIKAETEQKQEEKGENTYRSEFRYGKFTRTIPLPSAVDNSKAKAEYKDGILIVTVPKSKEEQQKIKKVSIES